MHYIGTLTFISAILNGSYHSHISLPYWRLEITEPSLSIALHGSVCRLLSEYELRGNLQPCVVS